ncbi:TrkH family potassium uptake protein [Anaerovorax odorimutans]|uniref:TrkH family potassium uptake protein n=1 Tax=Anaerovorax odorimutans TaxID=109327 RepID=A0ABT1RJG8_9FIRM|nr:TrkH family potassium uptake protein [Anaerovorax odorimutans]MCQ4635322.1 TrkH family potassium uptake protein [Anaerovorax odorimutans]
MNLSLRAVCRIIGLVLLVIGASMIPSLAVAGIYSEMPALLAFLSTILIAGVCGFILIRFGHRSTAILKVRDGFLIVTLCWIVSALIGAVPFVISQSIPSFIDAFFETCSGFSTTGASILSDVEALPKSILFWRSFTHWIGGMGILIFAIALMPSLGINGQNIAVSEAPGPTLDKITPKMSDTAKVLYAVYIIFTVVETVLLCLGGLSLYDALIHTFGSVGTGGYSNYGDSVAHFNSAYVDIVITVFMVLSGANFNLYYMSLRRGIRTLFKDAEFRFYLFITASVTALISLNLLLSNYYESIGQAVRYSAFQTASILTTTGFATTDFDLWPTFSKMLLMLLMFIGGCSSSTGGGVKVIRVLILLKLIRRGIATRLHPSAIVNVKLNGSTVPADTVTAIANHAFLYIVVIFISTILISLNNFNLVTSFTSVITCLGNIGPGFELVGPTANFSIYAGPAKVLLSFLMLAGRLELFTLFILLTPKFWNQDH